MWHHAVPHAAVPHAARPPNAQCARLGPARVLKKFSTQPSSQLSPRTSVEAGKYSFS
jgi:hypothetical protein